MLVLFIDFWKFSLSLEHNLLNLSRKIAWPVRQAGYRRFGESRTPQSGEFQSRSFSNWRALVGHSYQHLDLKSFLD